MMRLTIEEWKAAGGYDDLLAAYSAAVTERNALRCFVRQLRDDGLDIDDPTTAPTWTGKVFDGERLLFDLATVAVDAPAPEATTSPRG